jgi:hypothetical protein
MRTSKQAAKAGGSKKQKQKNKRKKGATLFFWYKWKMAIHVSQKLKPNDTP